MPGVLSPVVLGRRYCVNQKQIPLVQAKLAQRQEAHVCLNLYGNCEKKRVGNPDAAGSLYIEMGGQYTLARWAQDARQIARLHRALVIAASANRRCNHQAVSRRQILAERSANSCILIR